MATDSGTNGTQTMTAQTQTFEYQPPRTALAARSLAAVDRIADLEKRFEAFSAHMTQFPPTITSF